MLILPTSTYTFIALQENYMKQMCEVKGSFESVSTENQGLAQEKADLAQETEEARAAIAETLRTVQRLLAVVAVGDDDLIDPSACDALGPGYN